MGADHRVPVDGVDTRGAHRDVGDALQDRLDDHRDAELGGQLLGLLERGQQLVRLGDPDRLAAQALDDLDVVDAVDAQLRGVDVLELQVDLEVDVQVALRLADQPQIGVVHQDVDVRDVVLCADRQLLQHELEVVVAGERDHLALGVGGGDAQRGRNGPAERAGLAAVDPVARLVDVQHLRAGDLGEADRGDVARLRSEGAVHLLVHALRLQRHVVEVGTSLQPGLALLGGGGPRAAVRQPAGGLELLRHFDEELQRGLGVGGDAEVRGEDPAELGGLDVDVDERAALGVDGQVAGVPVGPAVADAQDEVRLQEVRVAVAVRGLQADHAGVQLVVVGEDAPAHQGRDDRGARQLGELDEEFAGIGVDDAATGDDHRALGCEQEPDRLLDLGAGRGRLVDGQRLVRLRVELDLRQLDVDRQVDEDRAGAARPHQMEGLLKHAGNLRGLQDGRRGLGHRLGDRGDVDGLEVLLVKLGHRCLAGDAEDRNGVGDRRVQPGDHVGPGGPRRTDADADVSRPAPGVALGHVGRALDMAGKRVVDATAGLERRVERVDRCARHAERVGDAFQLEDLNCRSGSGHSRHGVLLLGRVESGSVAPPESTYSALRKFVSAIRKQSKLQPSGRQDR